MSTKPSLPQGTRDFTPAIVRRRQYLLNTLRDIFERYGFAPIETPAIENLNTLTGKYGEEGDRLIFKILNNGLHEKKDKEALKADWAKLLEKPLSLNSITDRALRYDLTIPFARFVVQHQQELSWPFRRYQMQPVWRADRPQRGRYREFWQCDCDVVGSTSLLNEAELICIYQEAFHKLNLPQVTVKINSRKLLAALAEACKAADKLTDITVALDKMDKIGWDGVVQELSQRGLESTAIDTVHSFTQIVGTNSEKLGVIEEVLGNTPLVQAGIAELNDTLHYHKQLANNNWTSHVEIDLSLARGLNYYTGIILEVSTTAVQMGSIGGGGRYDDLTGLFGLKNLSGVGISFGIDRIYDVLDELNLFPDAVQSGTQILLLHAGGGSEGYALKALSALRNSGIAAEVYSDGGKLEKQLKYAHKRNLPYVGIIGESELEQQKISIKTMATGSQNLWTVDEIIGHLSTAL